jgi:hypothetical protein
MLHEFEADYYFKAFMLLIRLPQRVSDNDFKIALRMLWNIA